MLNVLTKNSLKHGWVGANHAHFEKQFRENDVTGDVMTSSRISARKVVMNVVLMFNSSFLSF